MEKEKKWKIGTWSEWYDDKVLALSAPYIDEVSHWPYLSKQSSN
jgi:hypothetical protein